MGVKGLKTYITKQQKDLAEKINIPEEIQKWTIDHDGKQPTILIDLKELAHTFCAKDEVGIVLGGRYKKYNGMLKRFLDEMHRINVKLVFFMAGNTLSDSNQPLFRTHIEKKYIKGIELYDAIDNGTDLIKYLHEKNAFSPDIRMTLPFSYNMQKLCHQFGEIYTNYQCHNSEMAYYISKHPKDVLAIITNDTDFLAFDGDFQYWSANDLHLINLDCVRYCRDKVRSKLDLNSMQLQLVSALSGHDFLPREYVVPFWAKLAELYGKRGPRIENLATYVKQLEIQPVKSLKYKVHYDLERISHDVFGEDYTRDKLDGIAKCLRYYGTVIHPKTEKNAFMKCSKVNSPFIYTLAGYNIFNIKDIDYIDYRNVKSKNYSELIVPVLAKLCGILNTENCNSRVISMKFAHDEPCKQERVPFVYPPMLLPPIFDLICKHKEVHHIEIRWTLFAWVLNFDEKFIKQIRSLKPTDKLKVAIITLQYLLQSEEITLDEAYAFILSEHQIMVERSKTIIYPKKPKTHLIRVAHLYTKIYVFMNHCLDICGMHSLTEMLIFDGPNFHNIMDEFEIADDSQKKILLSQAKSVWTFE